jgi:hypothetical protein
MGRSSYPHVDEEETIFKDHAHDYASEKGRPEILIYIILLYW